MRLSILYFAGLMASSGEVAALGRSVRVPTSSADKRVRQSLARDATIGKLVAAYRRTAELESQLAALQRRRVTVGKVVGDMQAGGLCDVDDDDDDVDDDDDDDDEVRCMRGVD